MADYPGALHTWDDVTDEEDIISGAHMNGAHAEIIAIEQEQIDLRSRFYAYRSSGWQAITTGAWRLVNFDGELYDEKNEFDSSSNYRFVAGKAGYYLFGANLYWNAWEAGKYAILSFFKNGANAGQFNRIHTEAGGVSQGAVIMLYLTAAQYVDVRIYTDITGTQYLVHSAAQTHFWGHKIS